MSAQGNTSRPSTYRQGQVRWATVNRVATAGTGATDPTMPTPQFPDPQVFVNASLGAVTGIPFHYFVNQQHGGAQVPPPQGHVSQPAVPGQPHHAGGPTGPAGPGAALPHTPLPPPPPPHAGATAGALGPPPQPQLPDDVPQVYVQIVVQVQQFLPPGDAVRLPQSMQLVVQPVVRPGIPIWSRPLVERALVEVGRYARSGGLRMSAQQARERWGQHQARLLRVCEASSSGNFEQARRDLLDTTRALLRDLNERGLALDDLEDPHRQPREHRLMWWRLFNLAWAGLFQKQKERYSLPGGIQNPQTLMRYDDMVIMGDEIVLLADHLESFGVVDWDNGLAERRIVDSILQCMEAARQAN